MSYRIIIYLALFIFVIFGYIKYIEKRSVFFPAKNIEFTPSSINLKFEDIYIKTQDNITINGWLIPHQDGKFLLLFCHGNAGNIADRLDKINILRNIGLSIFIFDYRGYGRSSARPSEEGLYLDAKAAYDYLLKEKNISPERIIVYGESLGAAIAINLASEAKVKAIILEGAFSSARDMAKIVYPAIPSFLFPNGLNSLEKIKKVKAPKLFLHSIEDEIVPVAQAKKLFSFAREPKYFIELRGGHNNFFLD